MTIRIIGELYEIDEDDPNSLIGEGGMGRVFRGRSIQTMEFVAVKELRSDLVYENPDQVARFNREAEALRRLNHPSIVAVLDSVIDGDRHYIIMEYVEGGTLLDLLAEEPTLPVERVLQICLDLADALTRAHRLKIVHRDVKPANVLLAVDGTPRLTDFGVARMDDKTHVTQTGTVVGTLHYLSPEALNGLPLDERVDIWAFGVMLYEMLAGKRPFDDDSTGSLINSILNKPANPLADLREDLPVSLVHLVSSMLVKDRNQRIDSVRKVGSELEDIIRGTDSDELLLNSEIREALVVQAAHRFETITSDEPPPPITSIGTSVSNRHSTNAMRDKSGQEHISAPKQVVYRKPRKMFIVFTALLFIALIAFFALGESMDSVEPVEDGEYMVLIADLLLPDLFSAVGEETTLSEFNIESYDLILSEVRQFLERDIPYSNIRLRDYNGVITSTEEARAVADKYGAAVIIWGESSVNGTRLFVQVGSIDLFPYNNFGRDVLERTSNVELSIEDVEKRSVTPYILGVLGTLHVADGNVFEFMRTLAILEQNDSTPASISSSGINADVYTFYANYLEDTPMAVAAITQAIDSDGGNPLLYGLRSLANARIGEFEFAARDSSTAQRIGPDDWSTAIILSIFGGDIVEDIFESMETLIDSRPNDWFYHYLLAEFSYEADDFNKAIIHIERSLELNPQANYPYILGFLIAIRQGEINDAAVLINKMVEFSPDPNFGQRVLQATFGETMTIGGLLYTSIGNLMIGQYNQVIDNEEIAFLHQVIVENENIRVENADLENVENLEELDLPVSNLIADSFFVLGIAQCAIGELDAAQQTYESGLQIIPDHHMLNLLMAESYVKQGDQAVAQSYVERAIGLSDELDQFIEDIVGNENIGCENFLTYFDNLAEQIDEDSATS